MLCGENSGQLLLCGVQIQLKGSHNHFSMALTQKEVTEVALRWGGGGGTPCHRVQVLAVMPYESMVSVYLGEYPKDTPLLFI